MGEKTKIVGVSYEGRQEVIGNINEMLDKLIAIREPDNPHDANALGIYVKKHTGEIISIGYVNRGLAAVLSPQIDAGKEFLVHDYFITGTKDKGHNLGVIFDYDLIEK